MLKSLDTKLLSLAEDKATYCELELLELANHTEQGKILIRLCVSIPNQSQVIGFINLKVVKKQQIGSRELALLFFYFQDNHLDNFIDWISSQSNCSTNWHQGDGYLGVRLDSIRDITTIDDAFKYYLEFLARRYNNWYGPPVKTINYEEKIQNILSSIASHQGFQLIYTKEQFSKPRNHPDVFWRKDCNFAVQLPNTLDTILTINLRFFYGLTKKDHGSTFIISFGDYFPDILSKPLILEIEELNDNGTFKINSHRTSIIPLLLEKILQDYVLSFHQRLSA